MSYCDALQCFVFSDLPVRGEIVHLNSTWQTVLARRAYPLAIQQILGEAMAAVALLSGLVKGEGLLTLQLQGKGCINLLVVQQVKDYEARTLRGMASWQGQGEVLRTSLLDLCQDSNLAITIEPRYGKNRYQGIVELNENSLAKALEGYFLRSEQIPTILKLVANQDKAAGLLLQPFPDRPEDSLAWSHVAAMMATMKDQELLNLEPTCLLERLFPGDNLEFFPPEDLGFHCRCSLQRSEVVLQALGFQELMDLLAHQDQITVDCEFCGMRYCFYESDIRDLFATVQPPTPRSLWH